jgi:hypothetical protein
MTGEERLDARLHGAAACQAGIHALDARGEHVRTAGDPGQAVAEELHDVVAQRRVAEHEADLTELGNEFRWQEGGEGVVVGLERLVDRATLGRVCASPANAPPASNRPMVPDSTRSSVAATSAGSANWPSASM